MPETLKIIALAVVQGIAEFLPISSSGHLAVLEKLFNVASEDSVGMIIVLHAGTLLAIVVYYFKTLLELIRPKGWNMIPKLIVATIPVGIVGMAMHLTKLDEMLYNNLIIVGVGFFITAFILLFGLSSKRENIENLDKLQYGGALFVGIMQCLALLPGVSRSGTTISAGLRWGLKKADAATFSFLIAIPAIGGATFVDVVSRFLKSDVNFQSAGLYNLVLGFCISAITGYFALLILLKSLRKGKLAVFAYYCLLLGVAVVTWGIFRAFS